MSRQSEYMRERRASAKINGEVLASDTWHKDNPEKHRDRVRRWRSENLDTAKEISRLNQKTRRSTPWGMITNRVRVCMIQGVKASSTRSGKYTNILGYKWKDLREHIEAQFNDEMSWENWGSYWELDHIIPISNYRYTDISDESFKQCWSLSNLRPLPKKENSAKGIN